MYRYSRTGQLEQAFNEMLEIDRIDREQGRLLRKMTLPLKENRQRRLLPDGTVYESVDYVGGPWGFRRWDLLAAVDVMYILPGMALDLYILEASYGDADSAPPRPPPIAVPTFFKVIFHEPPSADYQPTRRLHGPVASRARDGYRCVGYGRTYRKGSEAPSSFYTVWSYLEGQEP